MRGERKRERRRAKLQTFGISSLFLKKKIIWNPFFLSVYKIAKDLLV